MIRTAGGAYFNPDEVARRLREVTPPLTVAQANSLAWNEGVRLLRNAIAERRNFTFETTLGGTTIFDLLAQAAGDGFAVRVWYAGLRDPELHLARVSARVRSGGHDIPEADVRRRWQNSRLNLIRLLPKLAELRVFDNSAEADPAAGLAPKPVLVLHLTDGQLIAPPDLARTPEWAKPIVAAALKLAGTARRKPRRSK